MLECSYSIGPHVDTVGPALSRHSVLRGNPPDQPIPTTIKGGSYWCNYRIIPNKRTGRGDEVGGAFIMCTKMLICISRPHSAAAPSLSHATLVRTDCTSTLTPPLMQDGRRCNWCANKGWHLMQPRPANRQARRRGYHHISYVLIWARRYLNMVFIFRYIRIIEMRRRQTVWML